MAIKKLETAQSKVVVEGIFRVEFLLDLIFSRPNQEWLRTIGPLAGIEPAIPVQRSITN